MVHPQICAPRNSDALIQCASIIYGAFIYSIPIRTAVGVIYVVRPDARWVSVSHKITYWLSPADIVSTELKLKKMAEEFKEKLGKYRTAPFDARFPNQNQTRNCWANYLGKSARQGRGSKSQKATTSQLENLLFHLNIRFLHINLEVK